MLIFFVRQIILLLLIMVGCIALMQPFRYTRSTLIYTATNQNDRLPALRLRDMTTNQEFTLFEAGGLGSIDAAQNGTVLFTVRDYPRPTQLYLLNVHTDTLHTLAEHRYLEKALWSPDETQIAYLVTGDTPSLHVMSPGGHEPISLPLQTPQKPDFSWYPDGAHLTYWQTVEAGWVLHKVNINTSQHEAIFHHIDEAMMPLQPPLAPVWLDAHRALVSVGTRLSAYELNLATGEATQWNQPDAAIWSVRISADGTRLAYFFDQLFAGYLPNAIHISDKTGNLQDEMLRRAIAYQDSVDWWQP